MVITFITTVIATCLIGTGLTYLPPPGWQIVNVTFSGFSTACETVEGQATPLGTTLLTCDGDWTHPIPQNTVTLRRMVQEGEKVKLPEGCSEMEMQKDPEPQEGQATP
jgi:hypothetical protein